MVIKTGLRTMLKTLDPKKFLQIFVSSLFHRFLAPSTSLFKRFGYEFIFSFFCSSALSRICVEVRGRRTNVENP